MGEEMFLQTTMDLNLSKINHCPMSNKNSVLAFR